MPNVELAAVQVEYKGSPVPLSRPLLEQAQVEYIYSPTTSTGIIQSGIVDPSMSLAVVAGTALTSQVTAADLLAYSEVSGNASFDAESKWRYLIVQYLHRISGQIRNVRHRKVGGVWVGYLVLDAVSATGYWDHRSTIIRANNGAELILLPTRFLSGESLVVRS